MKDAVNLEIEPWYISDLRSDASMVNSVSESSLKVRKDEIKRTTQLFALVCLSFLGLSLAFNHISDLAMVNANNSGLYPLGLKSANLCLPDYTEDQIKNEIFKADDPAKFGFRAHLVDFPGPFGSYIYVLDYNPPKKNVLEIAELSNGFNYQRYGVFDSPQFVPDRTFIITQSNVSKDCQKFVELSQPYTQLDIHVSLPLDVTGPLPFMDYMRTVFPLPKRIIPLRQEEDHSSTMPQSIV